ncbi:hypothetical protein OPT61_g9968 [Boeremia exigua]|uniref:Uncharacterized protein n=1 Tax=Boeremia exigua TaxID=749465 RepID=A0ACC2HS54_9PLEO|nr:hypothetical protein OPT61_g9968 [Boeremia exigua]
MQAASLHPLDRKQEGAPLHPQNGITTDGESIKRTCSQRPTVVGRAVVVEVRAVVGGLVVGPLREELALLAAVPVLLEAAVFLRPIPRRPQDPNQRAGKQHARCYPALVEVTVQEDAVGKPPVEVAIIPKRASARHQML